MWYLVWMSLSSLSLRQSFSPLALTTPFFQPQEQKSFSSNVNLLCLEESAQGFFHNLRYAARIMLGENLLSVGQPVS